MSSEPTWVSVTVAPSPADRQVEEMLADPVSYFARARKQAEQEARRYVARRMRQTRVA